MILLGFGGNLAGPWGAPEDTIKRAGERLDGEGIAVERLSSLWRSRAFGNTGQPDFVNAVAVVETRLEPDALLTHCQAIEREAGRVRPTQPEERWGPRTLDIDLIAYHGRIIDQPALRVPHPGIAERAFVLVPLNEVAPRWRHPATRKTAGRMLKSLGGTADTDQGGAVIEKIAGPRE